MSTAGTSKQELLIELEATRRRVTELEAEIARLAQTERTLRRRAAEREAMFRAFPDLSFRLDADGTILDFHAGRTADLFTTPDQFLGKRVGDVLPAEVGQQHLAAIKRALGGEVVTLVYTLPLPTGEKFFEARLIPLADGQVYDVVRDITDRKRSEVALEASERYLNQAQALARLGNWRCNVKTGNVVGSAEFFRIFAIDRKQTTLDALAALVHPDDREPYLDLIRRGVERGEPWDIEHRLMVAPDAITVVHSRGEALLNDRGEVEHLVGTVQDITARIALEADKRALEAKVQQAQKLESLGILAGGVAHDFNNILCGVLGHASLALHELPPQSPVRRTVEEIAKNARQCAELTNQMLAYSGKGSFVAEEIDLASLVEEMKELLRSSVSKRVTLTLDIPDDLPAVRADATQIRQLLMNLVINGSEAIDRSCGSITVTVRSGCCEGDRGRPAWFPGRDEFPDGAYVIIQVCDNGCGMDAETRARIFDPFFTTKFTGRGLGLAAVHGIVRGHDGAIEVNSEVGRGTTFQVALPALDRTAERTDRAPGGSDEWRGSGTILVVDDEPIVRQVVTQMLATMGFTVLTAIDGQHAIERFRENQTEIVCIVLDFTMPQMDGETTFARLREAGGDVPVLLSSGFTEIEASERFAGKGLAGFVQKPYELRELRQVLRQILQG